MLIDAKELSEHSLIEGDVIIAGGGMAGITLARRLGDAGFDVVVLESGGLTPEARTQALYDGKTTLGAPGNESRDLNDYLGASRVRCFGGSGARWGGKCAPLDPIDFEKRDWVAHSGWPITRGQMQTYYDRACATLDLPVFGATPVSVMGAKDPVFAERSTAFTLRPRRYSLTTGAIGEAYDAFKKSASEHPRVRVYLNINVTKVQLDERGVSVDSLEVRELSGRQHEVRGRNYVLAMGGIENVRLMLVSNDVQKHGVGNHSDWLGRAFQGHTVIANDVSLWLHRRDEELAMFNNQILDKPHAVIGASDNVQRKDKTVNFTATITATEKAPSPAVAAVGALAQRLTPAQVRARRGAYYMTEHTPNRDSRLTLAPKTEMNWGCRACAFICAITPSISNHSSAPFAGLRPSWDDWMQAGCSGASLATRSSSSWAHLASSYGRDAHVDCIARRRRERALQGPRRGESLRRGQLGISDQWHRESNTDADCAVASPRRPHRCRHEGLTWNRSSSPVDALCSGSPCLASPSARPPPWRMARHGGARAISTWTPCVTWDVGT